MTKSLLSTRRYALFWMTSLLSNIGTWMQQVAQPLVLLSLSHSSFWVGADSFALNAPSWLFTLWGGLVADRADKKKIIFVCQTLQYFCVLSLLLFLLLGRLEIWMLLLSSLVVGATDSFSMPAFQAVIPSLVTTDEVPRAIALNSTQFQLSRVLGPVLAGILISRFDLKICYGANALSYLPFFASLFFLFPRGKKILAPQAKGFEQKRWHEHYRGVLREKEIQNSLFIVFLTSFCGTPLSIFCPVFIKDVYLTGASTVGWAMGAFGAGGVISGILAGVLGPRLIKVRGLSRLLPAVATVFVIACVLSPNQSLFIFLLFFVGLGLNLSNTVCNSRLQIAAGEVQRGRAISLFQLSLHAGISLGSLLTGSMASFFGIQKAMACEGALALLLLLGFFYCRSAFIKKPASFHKTVDSGTDSGSTC